MKLNELMRLFPDAPAPTRARFTSLCRGLAGLGVGIEPDVRFGGALPGPDDPVAVFASDMSEKTTNGFGITGLLLQLASFVAASGGEFSDAEAKAIRDHIHGRADLTAAEQERLIARMAAYRRKPPSASSLKKAVDAIAPAGRTAVVDLLIAILHPGGFVPPGEVKALETIYRLAGIETGTLYQKLHTLAAQDGGAAVSGVQTDGPIHLNAVRIEQLKAASAAVTDKLRVIFDAGPEEAAPLAKQAAPELPAASPQPNLLNLDPSHAELLTVLLGRPQWTRTEFDELCADKGLMADGAIEQINEAAYDKFAQPMIEGEDPLEISTQLLLDEKSHEPCHQAAGP